MNKSTELTTKFHEAALFITPERAGMIAAEVSKQFRGGAVEVSQKLRRLVDRWNVEHGYVINIHSPDGTEYYVAE